jgi:subtilisin family serine protease
MAAAFVTGAVALALARRPQATRDEIRSALHRTADPADGLESFNIRTGHGRLNIARLLSALVDAFRPGT